jgi:hypothetical protein
VSKYQVSVEKLDGIVCSWVNGQFSKTKEDIRKLSRADRARLISRFECNESKFVAIKVAKMIINGDF